MVALPGCGSGVRSEICSARAELRSALGAVESAMNAQTSGDAAEVDRRMGEVGPLVRTARGRLASADTAQSNGQAARAMLEAANYLDFMVGDFRESGKVDVSLAQFASRELNRASAGAGGAPLNC